MITSREIALKLAAGDCVSAEDMTDPAMVQRNLRDIASNCRLVIKQIAEYRKDKARREGE